MRALAATLIVALSSGVKAEEPLAGSPPLFTLLERTDNGKVVPYPNAATVDVDVNSSIIIHLNKDGLKALSAAADPAAIDQLTVKLQQLSALEDQVTRAAQKTQDAVAASRRAHAEGRAMTPEERRDYQGTFHGLRDVTTATQAYLVATRPNGAEQFENLLAEVPGDPNPLLMRFLATEHADLQRQVEQTLNGSSGRTLDIVAWLGSPPAQIHIAGYDNIEPGEAHVVDKTHFNFDDHFQAEYAAATQLSHSAGSLTAVRTAAQDELRAQYTALADHLREIPASVQAVAGIGDSTTPSAADPKVAKLVTATQALSESIGALSKTLLPILANATNPPSGANPATTLAATAAGLQSAAGFAASCATKLDSLRAAANDVRDVLPSAPALTTDLAGRLGPVLDAVARSRAATLPELSSVPVSLPLARDAEVSLIQTERKEGDLITIRARVLEGDHVLAGEEWTRHLRVRARGFVADTGAAVLLARGLSASPGPFVPAAGAYAVLRFKGWRSDGEAGSDFFQLLAPGIGVAALGIPQASDGSAKLAWIGTIHLFGDIFQAGIGTTTDAKPIWTFGLGLHRIAGLGTYLQ